MEKSNSILGDYSEINQLVYCDVVVCVMYNNNEGDFTQHNAYMKYIHII